METEVQAQGPSSQQALLRPRCPQGAQHYSLPKPRVPDLQNSIQGGRVPQDNGCAPKCTLHGILTRC